MMNRIEERDEESLPEVIIILHIHKSTQKIKDRFIKPNSYSNEYERNWNSWGVIHLCIDKTIHYFLKLDLFPIWTI